MKTMIQKYQDDKHEHADCSAWAAMIGTAYRGGGGGVGELRSLQLMKGEASPTVYYQYNDGAKNYHQMPASLAPHLEAAIKARFGELLSDALRRQAVALKVAAAKAVEEHAEMLQAAGLGE